MAGGSDGINVEWVAMEAGIKPANRVMLPPDRVDELVARAERQGFVVERGERLIEFPGRPPGVILYVARSREYARDMAVTEAPILPSDQPLPVAEVIPIHRRFGALLGFPSCCVEEFTTRLSRGVTRRRDGRPAHEDFVAAECAAADSRQLLARLNDLAVDRRARLVTFYPCRYDCPAAADYAGKLFAAALRKAPEAALRLRNALTGTMTIAVDGARGEEAARGTAESLTLAFTQF